MSGARSDDGRGTKPVWFRPKGIFCTVWLVQGCGMPGFVVQGPKSDDRDSLGSKNGLFPINYGQGGPNIYVRHVYLMSLLLIHTQS